MTLPAASVPEGLGPEYTTKGTEPLSSAFLRSYSKCPKLVPREILHLSSLSSLGDSTVCLCPRALTNPAMHFE